MCCIRGKRQLAKDARKPGGRQVDLVQITSLSSHKVLQNVCQFKRGSAITTWPECESPFGKALMAMVALHPVAMQPLSMNPTAGMRKGSSRSISKAVGHSKTVRRTIDLSPGCGYLGGPSAKRFSLFQTTAANNSGAEMSAVKYSKCSSTMPPGSRGKACVDA